VKLKFFTLSIFFLNLVLFQFSSAVASCDFEIDVGKKFLKKHEKKFGPLIFDEKTKYAEFFIQASDVCNGVGFDNIDVRYSFVDKKLLSINMFVKNQPKNNRTTDQLILMNFAKSKFGDFETGGSPKFYSGYHVWDLKRKNFAIYLKMKIDNDLWREELEISNYNFSEIINSARNSDNIQPQEYKENN
tara:strand:+ start:126 stop:689 length:564 start_codon:yes stop_codon:yes gene_type:complete